MNTHKIMNFTSLHLTLDTLASTPNRAAIDALLAGAASAEKEIREGAVRALVTRRGDREPMELLALWRQLDEPCKDIIAERPGRMAGALRSAILINENEMRGSAFEALLWLKEYELASALITLSESDTEADADLAAATLLKLVQILYDELAGAKRDARRRDPQSIRQHLLNSLEASIGRFGQHKRKEIVEAWLMLARRDSARLKSILDDPRHPAYLSVVEALTHSRRPAVMRLTLSFLDAPRSSRAALSALAHRRDKPFLESLLKKIGYAPSNAARRNLKRVDTIVWLKDDLTWLFDWSDAAQHAAVQVAVCSGMKRTQVFQVVRQILQRGKAGGRRAAAKALAEFRGVEANRIATAALEDDDPQVRAAILSQLRGRSIPGAMTTLIAQLDSPHAVIRSAAQGSLTEFTFDRYAMSFDTLSDEVKAATGALVCKVDPQALQRVRTEMESKVRTRRIRSLAMAANMGLAPQCEEQMIGLLREDEDHFVRCEAARALAGCDSRPARMALREALLDRSVSVQEAAEQSLIEMTGGEDHRRTGSPSKSAANH